MAGRRQRRMISHTKKRKTRAAMMMKKKKKRKIVKKEPQATVGRLKYYAGRTGGVSRRQDTVGEAAAKPIKEDKERPCDIKRTCGVCGAGRIHANDHVCPYNYVHGLLSLPTCREWCHPGMHPLLLPPSSSSSGSGSHHQLRRVIRVTNVPLSVIPGRTELGWFFRRFGPLDRCNLASLSLDDPVGFGWVSFESREHAQEAIDKLNGHLVGDRKLRVDWLYPQT